jgi:hypothetical protein
MPSPLDLPERPQPDRKRAVHRRCRVCDWEADQIEAVGIESDCPLCHAPTSIVRVLSELDSPSGRRKNQHAAALGRLGGLKGGPARAARLTARERRESARKAALARWANKRQRRAG